MGLTIVMSFFGFFRAKNRDGNKISTDFSSRVPLNNYHRLSKKLRHNPYTRLISFVTNRNKFQVYFVTCELNENSSDSIIVFLEVFYRVAIVCFIRMRLSFRTKYSHRLFNGISTPILSTCTYKTIQFNKTRKICPIYLGVRV